MEAEEKAAKRVLPQKELSWKTRKTRQILSLKSTIGGVGGVIPLNAAALVFFLPERKGGVGVVILLSLSLSLSSERKKKREFETFSSKGFDSRVFELVSSDN